MRSRRSNGSGCRYRAGGGSVAFFFCFSTDLGAEWGAAVAEPDACVSWRSNATFRARREAMARRGLLAVALGAKPPRCHVKARLARGRATPAEVPLLVHCPTYAHHVGERLLQRNFWRCRRGTLQAACRSPTGSGWRIPHGRCAWWRVPSARWILPTATAAGVRWHAARRWWLLRQCASPTSVYPASTTRRW